LRVKLADFPEVGALSPQEKLQLVDELWLSVAPQLDSLAVSRDERDLLDARWAAFLKNPSSALTLEQFREKMRKHRG
jgi:putative addiction module component (TIGR02574 family)